MVGFECTYYVDTVQVMLHGILEKLTEMVVLTRTKSWLPIHQSHPIHTLIRMIVHYIVKPRTVVIQCFFVTYSQHSTLHYVVNCLNSFHQSQSLLHPEWDSDSQPVSFVTSLHFLTSFYYSLLSFFTFFLIFQYRICPNNSIRDILV